ncbi:hypothetical protein ACJMK2_005444 [Sinanodonta woodiana]|uniref:Uncharacterized protein n=1 Tax=Sinanodonta woodiana TaxID=1069815 RepID=A0ABD3VQE6_SINWO
MKFNSGTSYRRVLSRLLLSLQLIGTFSAPVGDINTNIMTPCGGPAMITDANITTSNETISRLYILVNEAKSIAGTSTSEMAQAIGNAYMLMFWDPLSYFKIINADETEAGLDIVNGLGNQFKSNFGNFSELALYANVAASDAAANHVLNIKAVLDKLWTILCELQIGTLSQGESIIQYLNTSIISEQVLLVTSPEEIVYRTAYSWFFFSFLAIVELVGVFSAPVGDINNAIKTPCGAPVTITETNKKSSNQTISQLQILVNEAKSLAGNSRYQMVQAIGSSDMVMFLDNFNFFKVIKAEDIEAGLDIKNGLGQLFKSNFGNFSELAFYTDLAASDADANLVVNIKAVLDKLWTVLCELQIGTLSQGETITQYLNTSMISDQVRLVTSPEQIIYRNYIIMRDVEKTLGQFSLLYKYIKDRV